MAKVKYVEGSPIGEDVVEVGFHDDELDEVD